MAIAKASRMGLILSLFTFIIAFVVTASSTYAWFAMNESVSATNMQITVKSDSTYLVITSSSGTIANDASDTTLALAASNAQVFPVKLSNATGASTGSSLTWQTAAGTSYNDGTAHGGYTNVPADKLTKHYAKFTFYVGLNPSVSVVDAADLVVSGITVASSKASGEDPFKNAVSVAVVADGTALDSYVDAGTSVTLSNQVLKSTVPANGTPVQIDVYVYIDGDNTNVKTANAVEANLATYTVSVSFSVTPGTVA